MRKKLTAIAGRKMSVLWESTSELDEWGWQMEGLTGNYLRVKASAPSPRWNQMDQVMLMEWANGAIIGKIMG